MLNRILILVLFLTSLNAFACWKLEGSVSIDGETWKLNSKVEHGKEYLFPMGPFIFQMTLNKDQTLKYVIQEKKGTSLSLVTKGEEERFPRGTTKTIFAKGEEGQPHSILTIKLTNI